MTNTFFNSKEDYLLFRELFAKAVNHENAKSQVIHGDYGTYKKDGWMTPAHFVFANLVRGRHITHGFTPCTNKNKLSNGGNIWQGLDHAVNTLQNIVDTAHLIKQKDKHRIYEWDKTRLNDFLEPFLHEHPENHELKAMFMNLLTKLSVDLAQHEKYDTTFGKGRKIANEIIHSDKKPQNYQEFMEIVEKVENTVKEAA